MSDAADYGTDAPGVVRNLLLIAGAGAAIWATSAMGLWSGRLAVPIAGGEAQFSLSGTALVSGIGCALMAAWMLWDSKVGKLRERDRLLDRIPWTGGERVLDVGCGRGLLLTGAAKRLAAGKAIGIDIWQAEDLSGNRPEATLENARREGVADRVAVATADMRTMPFADASFDVVVSRAAIHNIAAAADRARAIGEIARVLAPGGWAVIEDIRNHRHYATAFAESGCPSVRRAGSAAASLLLSLITFGALSPATLVVRKGD